jgi:hypothetical protein
MRLLADIFNSSLDEDYEYHEQIFNVKTKIYYWFKKYSRNYEFWLNF